MRCHNTLRAIYILMTCVIASLSGCGGDDEIQSNVRQGSGIIYKTYGLNFGPYLDHQDPNSNPEIDEKTLIDLAQTIQAYTTSIRTYSCLNGLEKMGVIAHSLNLKIAMGAWIDSDLVSNQMEIERLAQAANQGNADILVIGSEVLHRGDLEIDTLLNYVEMVKKITSGIPIAYADNYKQFLQFPQLIDEIDILFVNYYPFWNGSKVEQAISILNNWHRAIKEIANGKPIVVSETGWPSDGEPVGQAVPSIENAATYFLHFVSWARSSKVDYFYFSAFDEQWKQAYEGSAGAHWGILDEGKKLKPGMETVFFGETVNDIWNCQIIVGGKGDPSIEFTVVPDYGSTDYLEGKVEHIVPFDYKVVIYINVKGRWWTKPYWNEPSTEIGCDGIWIADITTGGLDEQATEIVAYLVPNWYDPPLLAGSPEVPFEIEDVAVSEVYSLRANE